MITLRSLFSLTFVLAAALHAAEPLLITQPQPEIASPSFKEPLDGTWSIAHGRWTPHEGVLDVVELPENKHVPVLHHLVPLQTAVIECEVRFDKPGTFLVGCDAAKHVGRVIVKPDGLSIAEDSVKPSHTLATLKLPVKTGEWHRLRVEWTGDQMAANLDGHTLKAQHPYLATPKTRSWLAVGKAAQVRALKVSGTARAAAK